MRRTIALVVLLALSLPVAGHAVDLSLTNAPTKLYFSPDGGATQAIVKEIDSATLEILVQAYSFTSAPIAKALVDARRRGVRWKPSSTRARERRNIPGPLSSPIIESPSTSTLPTFRANLLI